MQDWEPVILRSATASAAVAKKSQPRQSIGAQVIQQIKKAEDMTVATKAQMLTGKSRSEMAQMRVSKGWTQKQLDMNGQFPANSCNAWEAGKLCPTGPQLQKLHRILGIKLERD
jgi:ribosome-binding protein aMBF1 (putative translation factor)